MTTSITTGAQECPPLAWTELEQVHFGLLRIEQIADGELRRLGLHKLADEIVAHTKAQRRWVAAHT